LTTDHARDGSWLSLSPAALVCTFSLAGLVLVAPLWLIALPPMSDLPGHAAALFIQTHIHSSPVLSQIYSVEWAPIPDLASELIVPLLMPLLPAIAATKAFLGMGVLLWMCGPAAVQYALFRRVGVTALVGALFAYNRNFTLGFVNYYFAAGVGFFVIAAWIASEKWHAFQRLAMMAALFSVQYFLHIMALAFAGFFLLIFELARLLDGRRNEALRNMAIICAAALPALLCLLIFPPGHATDGETHLELLLSLPERLLSLNWEGFLPEIAVLAAVTAWEIRSGHARVDERMRLPLLAVVILCLAVPAALFGQWGIHLRYTAMDAALLFAALELEVSPRVASAVFGATLCAIVVDAATLTWFWRTPDMQIREMRGALRQLAPGTKLAVAMDDVSRFRNAGFRHSPEYTVIDRAIFDPLVFTQKAQHILNVRPGWQKLAAATSDQSGLATLADLPALAAGANGRPDLLKFWPYLVRWPCNFDRLLLFRLTGAHEPVPPGLDEIANGEVFTLYRIERPADCARQTEALPTAVTGHAG